MAGGRSSSVAWIVLGVVETVGFEPAMLPGSFLQILLFAKYNIYIQISNVISPCGIVDTMVDSQ